MFADRDGPRFGHHAELAVLGGGLRIVATLSAITPAKLGDTRRSLVVNFERAGERRRHRDPKSRFRFG